MAVIMRPATDRAKLTIGEVEFTLSPLTWGQRIEVTTLPQKQFGGKKQIDMSLLAHRIVKYSVKGVKGVTTVNGEDYKLEFEDKGFNGLLEERKEPVLTDECAEDLITGLKTEPSLTTIAYQLIREIPDHITDENGKRVKGVKIEVVGKLRPNKRKKK